MPPDDDPRNHANRHENALVNIHETVFAELELITSRTSINRLDARADRRILLLFNDALQNRLI